MKTSNCKGHCTPNSFTDMHTGSKQGFGKIKLLPGMRERGECCIYNWNLSDWSSTGFGMFDRWKDQSLSQLKVATFLG